MNKFIKKIYVLPMMAALVATTGCMDNIEPTSVASKNQLQQDENAFSKQVNGLKAKMIATDTYGTTAGSYAEALADWGYPCYMLMRETLLDGTPTTGSTWNYQYRYEACTDLAGYAAYPYYYYYSFIRNANSILSTYSTEGATTSQLQQFATVYAYRAFCYMDLTMMYEFNKTGISELDKKAETNKVFGLTVPIVTENTTGEESKHNARAPFYTMYRFIYNDLSNAEDKIAGLQRSDKNDINIDVVNGLLARFWMMLGSRFEQSSEDLATQMQHESDEDGYKSLGITSAKECFAKAEAYADKVIAAGYQPLTKSQWHDTKTGFNTANDAWIWDFQFTSTEQEPSYWCTLIGIFAAEPTWGFSCYGGEYRCLSSRLFRKMADTDWRKTSWVAPSDAGAKTVPSKYKTQLKDETTETKEANTNWSRLPEYANLKFRPGGGDMDVLENGLLVAVPLMRVEEMYFIKAEAKAHTEGLSAGIKALEDFMNTYRSDDGSYTCDATTYDDFIKELIDQKYIEFWGEGVLYNDYKRLHLQVDRKFSDTNYPEVYQMVSKKGYTAPWLNFYVPAMEKSFNDAIVMNPDPTPYVKSDCK